MYDVLLGFVSEDNSPPELLDMWLGITEVRILESPPAATKKPASELAGQR